MFVCPQRITVKLPISRFKDIDADPPSQDFILQKRKGAFRSSSKALYRIITSNRKILVCLLIVYYCLFLSLHYT